MAVTKKQFLIFVVFLVTVLIAFSNRWKAVRIVSRKKKTLGTESYQPSNVSVEELLANDDDSRLTDDDKNGQTRVFSVLPNQPAHARRLADKLTMVHNVGNLPAHDDNSAYDQKDSRIRVHDSNDNLTPDNHTEVDHKDGHTRILSVDDLLDRLVIVSAISDNHVHELQQNLPSTHKCLPNNTFIVYDLGLSEENRGKLLKDLPYVEVRQFPFDQYKNLTYMKELDKCGWKPLMINLVAKEYEVVLYLDASQKLMRCEMRDLVNCLFEFPFIGIRIPYPAIEFTVDKMIEYLDYPKQRKDIAKFQSYQGGSLLLWVNSRLKEKFLNPWIDCALHKECMSPAGSTLSGCKFTDNHDGHFVGCHRYDQSALNLILAREFGVEFIDQHAKRTSNLFGKVYSTLWGTTKKTKLKTLNLG